MAIPEVGLGTQLQNGRTLEPVYCTDPPKPPSLENLGTLLKSRTMMFEKIEKLVC